MFSSLYLTLSLLIIICTFLGCLESANALVITPATVQKIVKSLHSLNCQYSTLNPALFAKYMPGINQSMTEDDLQSQINAERELQQVKRSWLEHWNFLRGIRQKNIFLEKFKNYVSKSNFLKFLYFFLAS